MLISKVLSKNLQLDRPIKRTLLHKNRVLLLISLCLLTIFCALSAVSIFSSAAEAQGEKPPNILLIVVDDMGYSDVGAFGGEIRTPNIDALAKAGLRLTDYYVSPTCSPTRSMLLSGTDNHLAGLGNMKESMTENQKGKPGYEGHLNNSVVSVASLLQAGGYHTYMAGKWHLGDQVEHDPSKRGFERAFTMLQGGASHFGDEWMMYANYTPIYREDGKRVHLPPDFYSSKFYTDKLMSYIDSAKDSKPFFGYLALTAPHDPLHVPDAWLDKYKGRYKAGYDALRTERLARMKKLGIVSRNTQLSHSLPKKFMPDWSSLSPDKKRVLARSMELYAAMIENLDFHMGRLFKHLKEKGLYDNTLIFFFSDNGSAPVHIHNYPATSKEWVERNSDNRYANLGRRGSRISIGPAWAVASNTPLRLFKSVVSEGGIRVPFIVSGPGIARNGQIQRVFAHVTDIAPTMLEVAGISHPSKFKGRKVLPIRGKSMMPFFSGKTGVVRNISNGVGWEFLGGRAFRQGSYKITWVNKPFGPGAWELFDLAADPTERNNLAGTNNKKLRELVQQWKKYANDVGVVLPEGPTEGIGK